MRRAFTLPIVMGIFALCFALLGAAGLQLAMARRIQASYRCDLQARSLARSGQDYARAMLRAGRWRGEVDYRSPDLVAQSPGESSGLGRFEVHVRGLVPESRGEPRGGSSPSAVRGSVPELRGRPGSAWSIESCGLAGGRTFVVRSYWP